MVVKDVFKCQLCNTIFYGKEYKDVDGRKYKTQEIHEHFCKDLELTYTGQIFGFGIKVGYCKIEEAQNDS